jgi:hypothetical protein
LIDEGVVNKLVSTAKAIPAGGARTIDFSLAPSGMRVDPNGDTTIGFTLQGPAGNYGQIQGQVQGKGQGEGQGTIQGKGKGQGQGEGEASEVWGHNAQIIQQGVPLCLCPRLARRGSQ